MATTRTMLTILGVAVLALAVQSFVAPQPRGLLSPVINLVDNLVDEVQNTLTPAVTKLDDEVASLVKQADDLVADLPSTLEPILSEVLVNIPVCAIKSTVGTLNGVVDVAKNNLQNCLDGIIKPAQSTVDNVKTTVDGATANVQDLLTAVDKCNILDLSCLTTNVLNKVNDVTKTVTSALTLVTDTTEEVGQLGESLVGCSTNVVANVTSVAYGLVSNVISC